MNCIHCGQPIRKYGAWSEYDPAWVHIGPGPRWWNASQYCEGNDPELRKTDEIATPDWEAELHV